MARTLMQVTHIIGDSGALSVRSWFAGMIVCLRPAGAKGKIRTDTGKPCGLNDKDN